MLDDCPCYQATRNEHHGRMACWVVAMGFLAIVVAAPGVANADSMQDNRLGVAVAAFLAEEFVLANLHLLLNLRDVCAAVVEHTEGHPTVVAHKPVARCSSLHLTMLVCRRSFEHQGSHSTFCLA